jgi:hypothetical protein
LPRCLVGDEIEEIFKAIFLKRAIFRKRLEDFFKKHIFEKIAFFSFATLKNLIIYVEDSI